MTKKHYIAIAAGFRRQFLALEGAAKATNMDASTLETFRSVVRASAEMVADVAAADNVAFDRARFIGICGF